MRTFYGLTARSFKGDQDGTSFNAAAWESSLLSLIGALGGVVLIDSAEDTSLLRIVDWGAGVRKALGRVLCAFNMRKWWPRTAGASEVEYLCARCGKRRSPDWEMPPI